MLVPAYDVLRTVAYHKTHNLTRRMAMSIGGEYRPEDLRARHLEQIVELIARRSEWMLELMAAASTSTAGSAGR